MYTFDRSLTDQPSDHFTHVTKLPAALLSHLYSLLGDGHQGYLNAATLLNDPKLALYAVDMSRERRHMQRKLGDAITRLLPDLDLFENSIQGKVHRAWIGLWYTWIRADKDKLMRECVRGENYLLNRYTATLAVPTLPIDLFDLLNGQQERVRSAIGHMSKLGSPVYG